MIEGNWSQGSGQSYKWKILRYMRYLAVITPYAEFTFRYADPANTKNTVAIKYKRRAFVMPAPPKTVKHHPSSIDLVIMANLIRLAKDNKMV